MSFSLTPAAASPMLQALADALDGGFIRIFSGAAPDDPTQAETGTLLGIVTTRGEPAAGLHFDVVGANLAKPGTPWVFQALAAGTASWFRLVGPDDPDGVSYSAPRLDGDIGTLAGSAMQWPSTDVLKDYHYTIDSFVYLFF